MAAEQFFTGTTQAGRTLVLFSEVTEYMTFVDAAGETVDNPSAVKITATLDGAPIEIESVNWSASTATVRTEAHGTFTATTGEDPDDHSAALRRYLEHRPSEGYEVAIVERADVDGLATFVVTITNGRLTARAEFRLSAQVMRTLARGAPTPTDAQVERQVAATIRHDRWPQIARRAEIPTTIQFLAHPL